MPILCPKLELTTTLPNINLHQVESSTISAFDQLFSIDNLLLFASLAWLEQGNDKKGNENINIH